MEEDRISKVDFAFIMAALKQRGEEDRKAEYPTGDCYRNAVNFCERELGGRGWIVHAICENPKTRRTMGHAWVEIDCEDLTYAYDPATGILTPSDFMRLVGKVTYSVTYSYTDACKKMYEIGTYGPWDRKIEDTDHR